MGQPRGQSDDEGEGSEVSLEAEVERELTQRDGGDDE